MFPARETFVFVAKALAVAAAAAGSTALVRLGYETIWPLRPAVEIGALRTIMRVAPEAAIGGAVSIAAAFLAIRLLRMEELTWVVDWFRKKRAARGRPETTTSDAASDVTTDTGPGAGS